MRMAETFVIELHENPTYLRVSGEIPRGQFYGPAEQFFFYSDLRTITISKHSEKTGDPLPATLIVSLVPRRFHNCSQ
jgi:hypothetical protein